MLKLVDDHAYNVLLWSCKLIFKNLIYDVMETVSAHKHLLQCVLWVQLTGCIYVNHKSWSQITLLLSGTRSSLMRRLVPQSLASSSSAISCRWNTATWADLRLTLPLGVRSKSSLSLCVALSFSCALCLSSCRSSQRGALCFSLGWLDGDLSCQSLLSGGLCSFLPAEGNSSVTTWGWKGEVEEWEWTMGTFWFGLSGQLSE